MHFPVVIIGAGPSGSLLAWILRQRGIESLVLERRSRAYVEGRIRAGVMEQNSAELMIRAGVGDRLQRECLSHDGIAVCVDNEHYLIDFMKLIGRGIKVYGQSEVTKDLLAALDGAGHKVLYETPALAIEDIESDRALVRFEENGATVEVTADFVVGCDGYHGPSRQCMPKGILKTFEKTYPYGWLGVMAKAPPSKDVAMFAYHDRGFALLSMRSPTLSRLYLQCARDEDLNEWPDERIWEELDRRLGTPGWELERGEIIQKDVTPLRSFFSAPMSHGRLFLCGDASHIVPPTGAKGLNSAFADVSVLSAGLIDHFIKNSDQILTQYAEVALRRNLQVQRFSWNNTQMYHVDPGATEFDRQMQRAYLEHLVSDETAQISYAQQHTGLPFDYWPEL